MLSGMHPYENLEAWKCCHELALAVYDATRSFPPEERYGLVSQTRRVAFSAPAAIAEGGAKRGSREFRRYLDVALGSLSELSYTLLLSRDLELISKDKWERLDALQTKAGRLTWGLYKWASQGGELGKPSPQTIKPSNPPSFPLHEIHQDVLTQRHGIREISLSLT